MLCLFDGKLQLNCLIIQIQKHDKWLSDGEIDRSKENDSKTNIMTEGEITSKTLLSI